MAFQVTDDILDIVGNEEVLGKPVLDFFRKTQFPFQEGFHVYQYAVRYQSN